MGRKRSTAKIFLFMVKLKKLGFSASLNKKIKYLTKALTIR